jgi:hypothetical protein
MKPTQVNILGIIYKIQYVDRPSDVDIHQRESLWGQIDYWTRTIRVYDNQTPIEDIWDTILHEVIHGLVCHLKLSQYIKDGKEEDLVGLLAMGINDTLTRNNWVNIGG